MKYNKKGREELLYLLKKTIGHNICMAHGFKIGKTPVVPSAHFLDVPFLSLKKRARLISQLIYVLEPMSGIVHTSDNSVYFRDTHFGNVSVFFDSKKS